MSNFKENRRAPRLEIEMTVALYDITTNKSIENADKFSVDVINISTSGLGFTTDGPINVHSFYKACLVFPTKDSMDVIIEVVRSQVMEDGKIMYGGAFVGISEGDKFKIEVYRLLEEERNKVGS